MKAHFKITQKLATQIREDLLRPHDFAAERAGFITCRFSRCQSGRILILANAYYPADEEDYVDDSRYGVLLGAGAFRKIFQIALSQEVGIFHVHLHEHEGTPGFSRTDKIEMAKYVPDFFNARPSVYHGALVLSLDSVTGLCWTSKKSAGKYISKYTTVGNPVIFSKANDESK